MNTQKPLDPFVGNLRAGIWLIGISCWIFGLTDRSIAAFADGYLTTPETLQVGTLLFLLVSWLFLKPNSFRVLPRNEGSI